jgi:hypothetical protein
MFKVSSPFLRFGRLCAQNLTKDLTWYFLRGRVYAGIVAEYPRLGKHLWRALCKTMFKVSSSFLRFGRLCAHNLRKDLAWDFLRGRVYAGIVAEYPRLGKHLWRALCEAMFKVSSSFLRSGSCAQNPTRDLKWIFWEVGFLRDRGRLSKIRKHV